MAILDLGEEWQRVVRGDEDEAAALLDGVERAEDRRVADGVRDDGRVEDGQVGAAVGPGVGSSVCRCVRRCVRCGSSRRWRTLRRRDLGGCAAPAAASATAAARVPRGGRGTEDLPDFLGRAGERGARVAGDERHEVVVEGVGVDGEERREDVGGADGLEGVGRRREVGRGRADGGVEADDDGGCRPAVGDGADGGEEVRFLGLEVRDETFARPQGEAFAGDARELGVGSGDGAGELVDEHVERAAHRGVVASEVLGRAGVVEVRGEEQVVHRVLRSWSGPRSGPAAPENSTLGSVEITPRPGYGPAAVVPRPSPAADLSRARRQVLELLVVRGVPTSVATVAAELGQHTNTVREHLEGLADAGLADRSTARPAGRGRPGTLYEARPASATDPGAREYAALASVLADQIARTSPDPRADALAAGDRWGRDLVAHERHDGAPHARRTVVRLLDRLGFGPNADATDTAVELRRCPLLDAALRTPEVVCAVHLGLARGALDALGAPTDRTTLEPFALPGACLLHLDAPEA